MTQGQHYVNKKMRLQDYGIKSLSRSSQSPNLNLIKKHLECDQEENRRSKDINSPLPKLKYE